MPTITKATRKLRTTKGNCYLTHGDDSYDKKGLKKARRMFDAAVIQESLEDDNAEVVAPAPTEGNVTFRVVVTTQVYENYNWTGVGAPYWKAKGGNEYQRNVGSAMDVIAMGSKGLEAVVSEMRAEIDQHSEMYEEYVIAWDVIASNEESYEERELREMLEWGYLTREAYESRLLRLQEGVINEP